MQDLDLYQKGLKPQHCILVIITGTGAHIGLLVLLVVGQLPPEIGSFCEPLIVCDMFAEDYRGFLEKDLIELSALISLEQSGNLTGSQAAVFCCRILGGSGSSIMPMDPYPTKYIVGIPLAGYSYLPVS